MPSHQQAVEREDYDEAKRLKGAVDRLRAAGGAIAGLEARKAAAVEQEDYDLAKQLKVEIDRHRWAPQCCSGVCWALALQCEGCAGMWCLGCVDGSAAWRHVARWLNQGGSCRTGSVL